MKEKELNKILETILVRMRYDLKKSYDENLLSEQMVLPGMPQLMIPSKEDESGKYPNYCSYKDKALKTRDSEVFKGYCLYPRPQYNVIESKIAGIWLPQDAVISFSDTEFLNQNAKTIFEKYHVESNTTQNQILNNLYNIFPLGTVVSFESPVLEGKYTPVIELNKLGSMEDEQWLFLGYKLGGVQGKKFYEEPKDTRDPVNKFLDGLSWWQELLPFIVVGILTRGQSTSAQLLEFAFSTMYGGLLARNQWMKGQKISATMFMLMTFVPYIKHFSSKLRGINPKDFNSLMDDISKADLKDIDDVKLFYAGLKPEKQKIFVKVFTQDEVALRELENYLNKLLENPAELLNFLKRSVRENPSEFLKLAFSEKLWVREMKITGALIILNFALDVTLGRYLNSEEESKIKNYYARIPDSHKKEFIQNLAFNPQIMEKVFDRMGEVSNQGQQNFTIILNDVMKDEVEKSGGTYIEDPVDPYLGTQKIEDTPANLTKYKKMGYKTLTELNPNEILGSERILIGDKLFVKTKSLDEKK